MGSNEYGENKHQRSSKALLAFKKREHKAKLREKRARLIVRNLPFSTTEDLLCNYFTQYGNVVHVHLLEKNKNEPELVNTPTKEGEALKKQKKHALLKGCGFVQFKTVTCAAKAKFHTDGAEFMGRKISVEFAVARDKYKKNEKHHTGNAGNDVKEENDKEIEIEDGEVDVNSDSNSFKSVKSKNEGSDVSDDNSESSDDDDNSNDDLENSDLKSEISEYNTKTPEKQDEKSSKTSSRSDVDEGKTVFIKNIPFSASSLDLKNLMQEKFGPIFYAVICVDKFTEHSKGTAFVKFQDVKNAERALNSGTELQLFGNILDCHPALGRSEIQKKSTVSKGSNNEKKDSRNLYLVKEGVILAGSQAAQGVSAADMAKRLQIEQYKTQTLRNLNMYVSRNRLVIYNLPKHWQNKQLRELVLKHSPKVASSLGVEIKEVRIMRDLKNVDRNDGLGVSKEFAFVTLGRHEDAIFVLRSLNNNPTVFGPSRRPIVTFSVENKVVVNARQKRMEKIKHHNLKMSKNHKIEENLKQNNTNPDNPKCCEEVFSGLEAKPGAKVKFRGRFTLNSEAKEHYQNLRKEKRQQKKKITRATTSKVNSVKTNKHTNNNKKKITNDKDNFAKIVDSYKRKLVVTPGLEKKKWYT